MLPRSPEVRQVERSEPTEALVSKARDVLWLQVAVMPVLSGLWLDGLAFRLIGVNVSLLWETPFSCWLYDLRQFISGSLVSEYSETWISGTLSLDGFSAMADFLHSLGHTPSRDILWTDRQSSVNVYCWNASIT